METFLLLFHYAACRLAVKARRSFSLSILHKLRLSVVRSHFRANVKTRCLTLSSALAIWSTASASFEIGERGHHCLLNAKDRGGLMRRSQCTNRRMNRPAPGVLKNVFPVADIQSPSDHDTLQLRPVREALRPLRLSFRSGFLPVLTIKLENINAFHLTFSHLRRPSLCVCGSTDDESVTRRPGA
jgi:hypothetical protein